MTSEQFRSLLGGHVVASELVEAEIHLNECQKCQARLERLAGEQDWFLAAKLDGEQLESPLLDTVLAHLADASVFTVASKRKHGLAHATPGLKDKLQPSSLAGSLGRFGDYEILGLLGQGGMGVVFEALHPSNCTRVAIKVLQPHAAQNKQSRARFLREAESLSVIEHENVVRVITVQEIQRTPSIVMEKIVGSTLEQWVKRRGPLEPDCVLQLAIDATRGLEASHRHGILHRDIKPANLLVDEQHQRLKITDFGLAKVIHDVGLTASNAVPGTPEYMSPEQIGGQPIDVRSDLFSLGTVLYYLVTGTNPFAASNILQVFRNVAKLTPPAIAAAVPNCNPRLAGCIHQLLAKQPAARPQNASELSRMFERMRD